MEQLQDLDVLLTDVSMHKQQKVARFVCSACNRCALVPFDVVGTAEQSEALERSRLCEQAIVAANLRYSL